MTKPLAAVDIKVVEPAEADVVITDTLRRRYPVVWNDSPICFRPRTHYLRYWQQHRLGGLRGRLNLMFGTRNCARVLAPDPATATRLDAHSRAPVDTVALPKPVDGYPVRDHTGEALHLLTLTNLDYRQKLDPILDALDAVEAWCDATNSIWSIAGDGTHADVLAAELRSGYPDIEYVGYVDAPAWLKRADALIHVSELDIQAPNAVLEAMASGLPVVTNDYPPFAASPTLSAPVDALDSVLSGLQCPDTRARIGAQNREYVANQHDPAAIGEQYRDALQRVVTA
ncbi:MAG: glycosyltransferase [Candidatus Wenzhouxiangella sp. M2_3B_020]